MKHGAGYLSGMAFLRYLRPKALLGLEALDYDSQLPFRVFYIAALAAVGLDGDRARSLIVLVDDGPMGFYSSERE